MSSMLLYSHENDIEYNQQSSLDLSFLWWELNIIAICIASEHLFMLELFDVNYV